MADVNTIGCTVNYFINLIATESPHPVPMAIGIIGRGLAVESRAPFAQTHCILLF